MKNGRELKLRQVLFVSWFSKQQVFGTLMYTYIWTSCNDLFLHQNVQMSITFTFNSI